MAILFDRDGGIRETRWWPTKTAAEAWLCKMLPIGAVILRR
jgi:hypothetical protein